MDSEELAYPPLIDKRRGIVDERGAARDPARKRNGPADLSTGPSSFLALRFTDRALAPVVAAEAVAAAPGRCRSPGLPSRPGRSALPEEAAEVAAAAVVAAEAAEPRDRPAEARS
jgi:hypothetical protein